MSNSELSDALSTWKSWSIPLYQEPVVIGELTAGNSHQSWRVKSGDHEFVVKCNNSSSRILSQTLHQELLCQRVAAAEGLAPEVVFDCERFFVSRFIEAEVDALALNWLSVGSRLKKIHSLKIQLPSFDVFAHIERYWQQINKLACSEVNLLDEVCSKMDLILPSVRCVQSELVLCHHDLNNSNVIFANTKPVFIDWEYAAPNHPYFDLATLQLRLSKDDYQQVIVGYGMGEPEMVKMNQYLCLVRYLEVLWWAIIDAKSTSFRKSFLQLQIQLGCLPT